MAAAISLTNRFATSSNPEIIASTTLPHVTVLGTGGGNMDYYSLTLNAGVAVTLDIDRAGAAGNLDSTVKIFNSAGVHLAYDDDSSTSEGATGSISGSDSFLTFVTPAAATYYIEVAEWSDDPIEAGAQYRLHVSIGAPPGDDVLMGGAGVDTLDGGLGADTASFADAGSRVTSTVTAVADDGFGNAETLTGIENLIGSNFKDKLTGNNFANRLEGGAGRDALDGKGGNDVIKGGVGDDRLSGSGGADVFEYDATAESAAAGLRDLVRDFSQAELDRIDLSGIDADGGATPEDTVFAFIGTDAFDETGGKLRYQVMDGFTLVQADVDGGGADLEIVVTGEIAFLEADFVL